MPEEPRGAGDAVDGELLPAVGDEDNSDTYPSDQHRQVASSGRDGHGRLLDVVWGHCKLRIAASINLRRRGAPSPCCGSASAVPPTPSHRPTRPPRTSLASCPASP